MATTTIEAIRPKRLSALPYPWWNFPSGPRFASLIPASIRIETKLSAKECAPSAKRAMLRAMYPTTTSITPIATRANIEMMRRRSSKFRIELLLLFKFEDHLDIGMVLRTGFEPVSLAREASILDRTILSEPAYLETEMGIKIFRLG